MHDMGGMHGLGPIAREPGEPVFHHAWEARVLALTLAMGAWRKWNIDASRHARERIPGDAYLAMSYYEKWLAGLVELMVAGGLLTRAEIESGRPAQGAPIAVPSLAGAAVAPAMAAGSPYRRDAPTPERFAIGDAVRAKNDHPTGHTRLPRYVRGRRGVVDRAHGPHVFPDTNAHGEGERPQPLYGVRFAARELWGQGAAERDAVCLDLWDSYLEPV